MSVCRVTHGNSDTWQTQEHGAPSLSPTLYTQTIIPIPVLDIGMLLHNNSVVAKKNIILRQDNACLDMYSKNITAG